MLAVRTQTMTNRHQSRKKERWDRGEDECAKEEEVKGGGREGKKSMESGTEGQQAFCMSVSKSKGRGLVGGGDT